MSYDPEDEILPGDYAELFQQLYKDLKEMEPSSVDELELLDEDNPLRLTLEERLNGFLCGTKAERQLIIHKMDTIKDPREFHFYNGKIQTLNDTIQAITCCLSLENKRKAWIESKGKEDNGHF